MNHELFTFMLLLTFLLLIKSIQLLLNRKHFSSKKIVLIIISCSPATKSSYQRKQHLVPIDPGKISEAACRQPTKR